MRILVITNLFPNPYQPDCAPFNRQQFRALADREPVAVIAPIPWTIECKSRLRGGRRLPPGRRVESEGVAVDHPLYLYTPKALRGWYGHFYRRSIRRRFTRLVAEFQPDLVLASWAYPDGWAAVDLAHRAGLPVVVKVHGCDVLVGGRGLQHDPTRHRRTAESLRAADGVVAVSQDLADKVIDLGVDARRVHVVYNGVDTARFHPGDADAARSRLGIDNGDPILLSVGQLEPVKGPTVLVEACARLAAMGGRFRCRLIGRGPLRKALDARIKSHGLEGRVALAGSVPHSSLPDWYRAASLFVLPSFSEGIPNVLLEASACGTPFVASRVGGIPELVDAGTGRLVPPGDAGALAEAIGRSLAGRDAPASFRFQPASWAESAANLVAALKEVVARPAQHTSVCDDVRGALRST